MPNHVMNVVKMKGIVNLPLFKMEDEVRCFDFNKIVPMPESLNVNCGSMTDESVVYYMTERCAIPISCLEEKKLKTVKKIISNVFYKGDAEIRILFERTMSYAYKVSAYEQDKMYKMGQVYFDNYMKYGYTTWYDWRCNYWGTKWGAYSNEQKDDDTITFQTAWSNPEPIMLKLSEMYPETVIEHWWADEDRGHNTGHRTYLGGEIVDGDYHGDSSEEAYETYAFCWGDNGCYDDDEYEEDDECEECDEEPECLKCTE